MKHPKFFCENCGAEVRHNAKVCPVCGKFFTSVKCPKCRHVGSEKDFRGGCPACGYSVPVGGGDPGFGSAPAAAQAQSLSPWLLAAAFGLLAAAVIVFLATLAR